LGKSSKSQKKKKAWKNHFPEKRGVHGKLQFLQRPGAWFLAAVLIGVLARAFLVIFTEGTYDVSIWKSHAQGILDHGLTGAYRTSEALNHPPLACWAVTGLLLLSRKIGVPFAIVLRAPLAIIDMGTAFLLGYALRNTRYRWAATALYAIHPLAIILSAYHGNTDCVIAFLLLLSVAFISEDKPIHAALVLGISMWIKLPGLLAAPALALSFRHWRERLRFSAVAAATGILVFVPVLLTDPAILYARVFSYPGFIVQTTAGVRVWGWQNFFGVLQQFPFNWQVSLESMAMWGLDHHRALVLIAILILAWMRRGEQSPAGLGLTIAASYAVVYALSNNWSFQYFAWSIPFWFMAGPVFLVGSSILSGAFIYALYSFDCSSPFLLGNWDFVGHPMWPRYLVVLRDFATLFYMVASTLFLIAALRRGNFWSRTGWNR
jgi:hypothetical protein